MLSRHFLFLADRFLAGRSLADQDPCLNLIELKALTLIGLFFRVPQVPKKTQGPQRSRRRIRRVKVDPHLFYLCLYIASTTALPRSVCPSRSFRPHSTCLVRSQLQALCKT